MKTFLLFIFSYPLFCQAQLKWKNVDSLFQPLPSSMHVYYSNDSIDGKPNIAYYVETKLKDKQISFTADTTYQRRITPAQFFEKNAHPLIVVNCTFFDYATNTSSNVVIKDKVVVAHNAGKYYSAADTTERIAIYSSALGISKRRKADVAWIKTDSSSKRARAVQFPYNARGNFFTKKKNQVTGAMTNEGKSYDPFENWRMQTAVGGGPALIQNGELKITNEEERKFYGAAINDKHPRTGMGYTRDGKLIIMVIQGRFPKVAEGATLTQEAQMLKDVGCWEALNLDGGGSSCMLINGKETIKPSDKTGQRPIPAVFIIKKKK